MTTSTPSRNVPIGYLRTFLTLLVVAHHAVLAYHPYAPAAPPASLSASPLWTAFPVVDSQRWPGVDLFVGFNDTFFMSLMFLVSGLFAWPSLSRKGASRFVRDRVKQIAVPFVVAAALLAPLAYYPTYLSMTKPTSSFRAQWLALDAWPAGPAWFLWVLFVFGCLAAALYAVAPGWGTALGRLAGRLGDRPIVSFGALLAASAVAYLPMAIAFDPMRWVSAGPFYVQISRLLLYATFFFAGAALGANGVDRGLLAPTGKLARRWPLWIVSSILAFVFAIAVLLVILSALSKGGLGLGLRTLGNFAFILCCTASSFACLALFTRFAKKSNRIVDSLSANAYGIYLLHYVCVSWLQLALLDVRVSAPVKGLLVFLGTVIASWIGSALFRFVRKAMSQRT